MSERFFLGGCTSWSQSKTWFGSKQIVDGQEFLLPNPPLKLKVDYYKIKMESNENKNKKIIDKQIETYNWKKWESAKISKEMKYIQNNNSISDTVKLQKISENGSLTLLFDNNEFELDEFKLPYEGIIKQGKGTLMDIINNES